MDQIKPIIAGAQYELRRLGEREHILSAVIKAIDRFDEVTTVARSAESGEAARAALMDLLGFDQVQATAVANMQVFMLARRQVLADEHDTVTAAMAEMESVLAAPELLVGTERGARLAATATS